MSVREEELPAAKRIVEDMVNTFQSWTDGAFDPGQGALVKEFERVRLHCVEDALASFRPEDREALENFSRDLMRNLLKVPAQSVIKNGSEQKGENKGDKIRGTDN